MNRASGPGLAIKRKPQPKSQLQKPKNCHQNRQQRKSFGRSQVGNLRTWRKQTSAVPVSEVDAPIELAPAAAIVSELAASSVSRSGAAAGRLGDDEVTAALASLAPANGHGDSAAIDREGNKWELASRDQVPVTMAVAGATQEFSGPRWIAESVALLDDEATIVLEQEMEKAYAAFAAADAAGMSFAGSHANEVPSPVAEAPATNSESVSYPVASSSNSGSSEPTPPEPAMQAGGEESAAPGAEPNQRPFLRRWTQLAKPPCR